MKSFKKVYYTIRDAAFDACEQPIRFAVITDLHNARFGTDGMELARAIDEIDPHAVLSAGDLMTAKNGRLALDNAVRTVQAIAGKHPFYYADGNHELRAKGDRARYGDAYERFGEALSKAGAVNVNDRRVDLEIATDCRIYVSGYAGVMENYKRRHRRAITEKDLAGGLGACPKDGYNILLAHHPDFLKAYAAWGADLTLSGHVHGGMVRLPLIGGIAGSTLMPFPKYDLGMYEENEGRMIVSAGLGAHTIPIRIFNPPQLVVVDLVGRRVKMD